GVAERLLLVGHPRSVVPATADGGPVVVAFAESLVEGKGSRVMVASSLDGGASFARAVPLLSSAPSAPASPAAAASGEGAAPEGGPTAAIDPVVFVGTNGETTFVWREVQGKRATLLAARGTLSRAAAGGPGSEEWASASVKLGEEVTGIPRGSGTVPTVGAGGGARCGATVPPRPPPAAL